MVFVKIIICSPYQMSTRAGALEVISLFDDDGSSEESHSGNSGGYLFCF
jgi:hypothetical protein